MFLNNLVNYIASHATVLLLTSMLLILILLILVVYTMVRLSSMRARYREMMRGSQSDDLEGMLLQHISAVEKVAATNARILEENELNGEVLYVVLTATREKVSSCDREITIKWGIRREGRPGMSNTYCFKGLPSGKLVEANSD